MKRKIKLLKYRISFKSKDIQAMLDFLNDSNNYNKMISFIKTEYYSSDISSLISCIDSFYYENFDRYDSDVCESFIYIFRNVFLPGDIRCPDGRKRNFSDYKEYVRNLKFSKGLWETTLAEKNIIKLSGL